MMPLGVRPKLMGGWWKWDMDSERKHNYDSPKRDIIETLRRLIDDVETGCLFGEFGVTFKAQNGRIGHFEEVQRRVHKLN